MEDAEVDAYGDVDVDAVDWSDDGSEGEFAQALAEQLMEKAGNGRAHYDDEDVEFSMSSDDEDEDVEEKMEEEEGEEEEAGEDSEPEPEPDYNDDDDSADTLPMGDDDDDDDSDGEEVRACEERSDNNSFTPNVATANTAVAFSSLTSFSQAFPLMLGEDGDFSDSDSSAQSLPPKKKNPKKRKKSSEPTFQDSSELLEQDAFWQKRDQDRVEAREALEKELQEARETASSEAGGKKKKKKRKSRSLK